MAGESWKSHKNSALERDMDADHDAQLSEWTTAPGLECLPAEIEQHERDQLQREYDAGMYRDGDVAVPDGVGDRAAGRGEPGAGPAAGRRGSRGTPGVRGSRAVHRAVPECAGADPATLNAGNVQPVRRGR